MKLATSCTPPPTPSASSAVRKAGRPIASNSARGAGQVEEIREGAADVDGQHEHQVHDAEEQRERGPAIQQHCIERLGQRVAAPGFVAHRVRGDRADRAITRLDQRIGGAGAELLFQRVGDRERGVALGIGETRQHRGIAFEHGRGHEPPVRTGVRGCEHRLQAQQRIL
jgi:hypothetical protein